LGRARPKCVCNAAPEAKTQLPANPQRRQVPGSNAFVPATVGLIVAGEVVKDLTAWERPL